mmetsp:Transcript_43255/g.117097  ORF Transcript_43255/g.117097 Transcript_43255/m.117097 type:complete len:86 (-) Transcript_43255:2390-2647(-)
MVGTQDKTGRGVQTQMERMEQITPVIFPPLDTFYDVLEQRLPQYGPYARGDPNKVLCAFLDAKVSSLFFQEVSANYHTSSLSGDR